MADYKNGDVVTVVNADGDSKEVTYKAYNVVYKGQGYKLEGESAANESGFSMDNTAAELKAELDRLGIEYAANDKKERLLELIGGADDGE